MAELSDDGAVGGYEPDFVTIGEIDTRYYHFGSGPTAVLLHGGVWGGSASANSWAGAFDELADRFEVYAFDRVGCGLSDVPDDVDALDMAAVVEHTLGFLDAFDIERCHLFGSSFGAGIATFTALDAPERVEMLVLTNSGTISPPTGDPDHRRALLNRGLPEDDGSLEAAKEQVRYRFGTFYYSDEYITDEFVDTVARMGQTDDSQRMQEAMRSEWGEQFQTDLADAIHEAHSALRSGVLSIPTQIVWGRNDPTAPLAAGRGLFDLFGQHESRVEFLVLNHAGHVPYNEHPVAFADATERFVGRYGDA